MQVPCWDCFQPAIIASRMNLTDYDIASAQSSDGRVIRASASGAVDSGLSPRRVKPIALKLVFTASLLDTQH